MQKNSSKTIDCTPTWFSLTPLFFEVLENGNEIAKGTIKKELQRMAKIADAYVSLQKSKHNDNAEKM